MARQIRMSGLDFDEFLNDPNVWPGDTYMDEDVIFINGEAVGPDTEILSTIKPTDRVVVEGGDICRFDENGHMDRRDLLDEMAAWIRKKKAKDRASKIVSFVVKCPEDKLSEITRLVQEFGGTVYGQETSHKRVR